MPIVTGQYNLDLSRLPTKAADLRIKVDTQILNGKTKGLLLHPATGNDFEPGYYRYMCGIGLKLGNGLTAGKIGQIVVTGRRLLGMVTDGTAGDVALSGEAGVIYAFSIDLDDFYGPQARTNWRGKPVEAVFRSKEDQPLAFILQVFSVAVNVTNDGKIAYTSVANFITKFSPESRQALRKS